MTDVYDRLGQIGTFVGLSVHESRLLPRGKTVVLPDEHSMILGIGLERGVRYWVPGLVRRGYLVTSYGERAVLVDAATGKLVDVLADFCIELDTFASWIGVDAIQHAVEHYGP